jgi:magnesium-transporting ATPase (P-type)
VAAHALSADKTLAALGSSRRGLGLAEVEERRARFGANELPVAGGPGLADIVLRQFLSPIIYILLVAAVVSALLGEWTDAAFIAAVLLLNAAIGTAQEYGAERSAAALRSLVVSVVQVVRGGEEYEVASAQIVPGDLVRLESGNLVPADLRLLSASSLQLDESLLTGESLAVTKDARAVTSASTPLGDRVNMAFAGTIVARGRGTGVVVATARATELGRIAASLETREAGRPPLLLRMERFTRVIGVAVGLVVLVLSAVQIMRGFAPSDVFHTAVALAVSAIPEGLPVALTVALAVASARMARRNVIVRRLVAVESLGSCTFIASDKTGTLTLNQLTGVRVALPAEEPWDVSGSGTEPEGELILPAAVDRQWARARVGRLAEAAALCNDGFLGRRDGVWVSHGDAVDVALLVLAEKVGVSRAEMLAARPLAAAIPFESDRQYAATLNESPEGTVAFVKGAAERVLEMCTTMAATGEDSPLDAQSIAAQADGLAAAGLKVIAVAAGRVEVHEGEEFSHSHLQGLTLLGLIGLIDPLRPEARSAVGAAQSAGVQVAMVTGDHPVTALAIARELGLAESPEQVVTGPQLRVAAERGERALAALVEDARVFARVEPDQKEQIVRALTALGHFVAVTGDGVNDAPALRAAHVGVAMGRSATDVAREASDLIITDGDLASVVAGIEEGRVAYANVRKVVYLLLATGAAEILLVLLSVATGKPLPLLPVQLLWLNLVTNGIQDVALGFEPAEGDELRHPPRSPQEPIFNRLMIERVLLSAAVIGLVSFATFSVLLDRGVEIDMARNLVLLQLVLFENVLVGNARSEVHSALRLNPFRNPILLAGTLAAQSIHLLAMQLPGLRDVLALQPVSLQQWAVLLALALSVFVAMEAHKLLRARGQ